METSSAPTTLAEALEVKIVSAALQIETASRELGTSLEYELATYLKHSTFGPATINTLRHRLGITEADAHYEAAEFHRTIRDSATTVYEAAEANKRINWHLRHARRTEASLA